MFGSGRWRQGICSRGGIKGVLPERGGRLGYNVCRVRLWEGEVGIVWGRWYCSCVSIGQRLEELGIVAADKELL